LISIPAIAGITNTTNSMMKRHRGMSFQDWQASKEEGYIMSGWIKNHSKLDSNMTMTAGYDKDLNRLYVKLKTKNTNNVIPDINGKKVGYQIDRFAVECDNKKFGILETKVYDKNNQLITTLNNRSSILAMIDYSKPTKNEEKIGAVLGNYACKSPYAKYPTE
jgi:uncharacterized FlaG/YvyC family protein